MGAPGSDDGPGTVAPTAAVVLTGGTGSRLGGADKADLAHDGRRFLDRALAAVAALDEVVVVGDPVEGVRCVREEPPGGGPAAGVLAGLDALGDVETVVVLAVDMPLVTPATVARLRAAYDRGEGDGALLVDGGGRSQYLCGVYRVAALRAAAPEARHGLPMRRLLAPLSLVEVHAEGGEAHDVDEWADLGALDEGRP